MSDESPLSIKDFGASFKGFLEQVTAHAPAEEPFFAKKLREHFGGDPALLPTLRESFSTTDHANLQLAIDAVLSEGGRPFELLGMISDHPMYGGMTFSQLIAAPGKGLSFGGGAAQGPVEYVNLRIGDDELLACVQRGLYVIGGVVPSLRGRWPPRVRVPRASTDRGEVAVTALRFCGVAASRAPRRRSSSSCRFSSSGVPAPNMVQKLPPASTPSSAPPGPAASRSPSASGRRSPSPAVSCVTSRRRRSTPRPSTPSSERYSAGARGSAENGRITIFVSHRFSTVRMADLIVVLDGARVVEVRSHEELVTRGGQHAELYGIRAAAYR